VSMTPIRIDVTARRANVLLHHQWRANISLFNHTTHLSRHLRVPLADLPSNSYMQRQWRKLLSNTSKIAQAEARFKSSQKERDDKQNARSEYEADQDATRKRTERLRALPLAQEATAARVAVSERPVGKRASGRKAPATS